MITRPALKQLENFNVNPTTQTASAILGIPTLHQILRLEGLQESSFSLALLGVCKWLEIRASTAFSRLVNQVPSGVEDVIKDIEDNWRAVCRITAFLWKLSDWNHNYRRGAAIAYPRFDIVPFIPN
jgi:hypothetical protein